MAIEKATRLKKLPPYLFAEIDRKKKAAIQAGRDVINLGVGDPDQPTPDFIIEALNEAARDPRNHQYALDEGSPKLRKTIAEWYHKRFGVSLDPVSEILPLIGSKEGIAHLPLAVVNPGDICLVPEPCYPPYRSGTIFAGGVPVYMDLTPETGFLPTLEAIDPRAADAAKLIYVNYPNNPTAAVAGLDFYQRLVAFAKKHDILVCSDLAYSEMYYEEKTHSALEVPGAKDVVIEMHSLSKTFNMTGWRVGFAVGNKAAIAALAQVKSNADSGIFGAIQDAAVAALCDESGFVRDQVEMYRRRRDALVDGLCGLGWNVSRPPATFYVWFPVPKGYTSEQFCTAMLEKADIVMTPGNGFGRPGEGFARAALTVPEKRIAEAVERIRKLTF
ncbi:MAG TPA: LL-diaminopimelate aminotransferase [Planctomycetota bacterium]|nr:LL-diaminopimelate aminotransferase [Planctomycetota bacterium]